MDKDQLLNELNFKAIRSSGAGGQHVNKTSSKIELTFNLEDSLALNEDEKSRIRTKLASKITNDNNIIVYCEETRSQHKNKELAIKRLVSLLKENLKVPKKRKATKPSRTVIKKNIEKSKRHSMKKALRKRPKID